MARMIGLPGGNGPDGAADRSGLAAIDPARDKSADLVVDLSPQSADHREASSCPSLEIR